jgi:hypothetical protein
MKNKYKLVLLYCRDSTTLGIMALCMETVSIMAVSITRQFNVRNDFSECHQDECHYSECRSVFPEWAIEWMNLFIVS